MRNSSIPTEYTDWLQQRVQGQRTTLCFNDFRLEPFEVFNSLDQGCPASGPYFLFYNKGLLNILKTQDEITSAFVDDTYLAARAQNIGETYNMLKQMMMRPQGALD